jgi:hypothetical protein
VRSALAETTEARPGRVWGERGMRARRFTRAGVAGRPGVTASPTGCELAIVEWVGWFNTSRLHSALKDLSPQQFDQLSDIPMIIRSGTLQATRPDLRQTRNGSHWCMRCRARICPACRTATRAGWAKRAMAGRPRLACMAASRSTAPFRDSDSTKREPGAVAVGFGCMSRARQRGRGVSRCLFPSRVRCRRAACV